MVEFYFDIGITLKNNYDLLFREILVDGADFNRNIQVYTSA